MNLVFKLSYRLTNQNMSVSMFTWLLLTLWILLNSCWNIGQTILEYCYLSLCVGFCWWPQWMLYWTSWLREWLEWLYHSSMKKMRKSDPLKKFWKKCWRSGYFRLGCIHDEFWIHTVDWRLKKTFKKTLTVQSLSGKV